MTIWKGTAVPNNELINVLYLNTNLTNEEMIALIDSLELKEVVVDGVSGGVYPLLYNSTFGASLIMSKVELEGVLMYSLGILFDNGSSFVTWDNTNGWNQEGITFFEQGIGANLPIMNELDKSDYFNYYQNDKLSSLLSITPFKQAVLDLPTFLTNIANAIRYKKETNDPINAQDYEQEILSITGGVSLLQEKIIDTTVAVPDTGTINKITFNGYLTEEEVVEIINNANLPFVYDENSGIGTYYIMKGVDYSFEIKDFSKKYGASNAYDITVDSWVPLFSTTNLIELDDRNGSGWNVEIFAQLGGFSINFNTPVEVFDNETTKGSHGTKNEALRRLVNIDGNIIYTGEYETAKELKGDYYLENYVVQPESTTTYNMLDYLGEKEEVTKTGTLLVSNPDTLVEKIYFNTDLSISEVNAILDKITAWSDFGDGTYLYACCGNSDFSDGAIGVMKMVQGSTTLYVIMGIVGGTQIIIYDNIGFTDTGVVGWQTFDNPITINKTLASEGTFAGVSLNIASENSKLTSLISMNNDFETQTKVLKTFIKNLTVDIYDYISEGYLKPEGTLEITENGTVDVSQYESATVNVPIPEGYIIPTGTKTITENGTTDVTSYANVNVNVLFETTLQEKTVTPTESSQVVACDDGYGGLSQVTVDAIPNSYIEASSKYDTLKTMFSSLVINFDNSPLPDDIVTIGRGAFAFKYISPSNLVIPSTVTKIDSYAFYESKDFRNITIPDSVTSIGSYVFCNCYSLESVTIGNGVTSIESNAFQNCFSLTSITIPNSVTSIGSDAFHGCTSLTSILFENGSQLTTIESQTFSGCSSLESITIPNGVTSIGNNAVHGCTSLTSIEIPSSVTNIGNASFQRCTSVTNITIPDSVVTMGKMVFQDCTLLTNLTIPDSVTSIDYQLCYNCPNLENVVLGSGLTSVPKTAFRRCISLKTITIKGKITSIGNDAFNECTALTDVYYTGTEEEWNAITVGTNNTPLSNATIHYNYVPE